MIFFPNADKILKRTGYDEYFGIDPTLCCTHDTPDIIKSPNPLQTVKQSYVFNGSSDTDKESYV